MDETDIREFLAGDYRRLVAGLSVIAGGRAAAEDAVQEALARAWERSLKGERIESPKAWVAVVARNILRSGFRRLLVERRARIWLAQDVAGQEGIGTAHEHAPLLRAVAALSRRQREAVALHYFADLSLAEVAHVVGTSEGAVKGLLHRARRSLADALGDRLSEEVDGVPRGG